MLHQPQDDRARGVVPSEVVVEADDIDFVGLSATKPAYRVLGRLLPVPLRPRWGSQVVHPQLLDIRRADPRIQNPGVYSIREFGHRFFAADFFAAGRFPALDLASVLGGAAFFAAFFTGMSRPPSDF